MLNFNVKNRVLSELIFDGKNIIYPWGIETSDSYSFYSMEENIGYRYKDEFTSGSGENFYKTKSIIKMREGKLELNTLETMYDKSVVREVIATCLEDTYLLDFVLRFRFRKEFFKSGEISGKKVIHQNSNINHQFPVSFVVLKGEKFDVNIETIESQIPSKMKGHYYLRDYHNEWIIHARMLPIECDKAIIKLCNSWYKTRPINQNVTNLILKSKVLKNYLWYRGERGPYKLFPPLRFINANAFPMVKLPKGTKLRFKVKLEIR